MVKKRPGFVFFMAALTAGGIILFQVYWVYHTYKTAELNFIKTASTALEKSIDAYQLQQNDLPTSLKYKVPYLSFMMRTFPNLDPTAPDMPRIKKKFNMQLLTVAVDKDHLEVVRALVARLLSQQLHKPLSLDTLTSIFKKELQKENIAIPFKLVILKNQSKVPPGKVAAAISFYKSPTVVEAVLDSKQLLLAQNLLPAAVSLLLILLSAGSLFYMGIVIKRQMRLDDIKNDFINNITHELRTPIAILKSSNEALAQFGAAEDPERLARHLQINAMVLDKLDSDVDRVLEIAQYEQGVKLANMEPVNLVELIGRIIQRFSLNNNNSIRLDYRLSQAEVTTDPYIMDTIISNLVDNAIKYSEGKVEIQISISPLGQGWQLQISDNGKGIKSIYLPLIFDKFYRIQTGDLHDVKGYGLGLSYVRQLVSTLKGNIKVTSKPGKGTTFTLEFPQ
jgi:two-component system phosphate regulon sensor histidine kinase PhoR